MATLTERMESQMKKAFWDLLQEKVSAQPPDFDWITRLYTEIRDRLMSFVRKGGKLHTEIEEAFDTDLFSQMIRNDAFDGGDMLRLVESTFAYISALQAPYRDAELLSVKATILTRASEGGTFAEIVPLYIRSVHKLLDYIEYDLKQLAKRGSENKTSS